MKKEKIIGVYQIKNKINGRIYVGSSTNIESRFCSHRGNLKNEKHSSPYLQEDWTKYGEECFVFQILETYSEIDKKFLLSKEQEYLDDEDIDTFYNVSRIASSNNKYDKNKDNRAIAKMVERISEIERSEIELPSLYSNRNINLVIEYQRKHDLSNAVFHRLKLFYKTLNQIVDTVERFCIDKGIENATLKVKMLKVHLGFNGLQRFGFTFGNNSSEQYYVYLESVVRYMKSKNISNIEKGLPHYLRNKKIIKNTDAYHGMYITPEHTEEKVTLNIKVV